MKKRILIILAVAMLLLTGCSGHYLDYDRFHSTQKPDDYIYQIGEEVRLYESNDKDPWVCIEIKNVIILADTPGHIDSIQTDVPPQAIAQVNYVITQLDDFLHFNDRDLEFYDAEGNPCPVITSDHLPCEEQYSQYEKRFIAIPVKGEYVEIRIPLSGRLDTEERRNATIRGYYGVGAVEVDPTINHNLTVALIWLGLGIVVSVIITIILTSKRKKLKQELDGLKSQYAPPSEIPPEPVTPEPKGLPLPGLPAGDHAERSDVQ